MSFGGAFGGFGQNNQSTGFGSGSGFGGTSSQGFGSTSAPSPFGGGNTGGSLFGNTSSSFGSGGAFGSGAQNQSNTLFGGNQNRPSAFGTGGTSTGGGMFGGGGGGTSTAGGTGFGGFGSGGGTGFGSSGTGGGGLFNKPGGSFGSSPGTGGGFGSGGGFGGGSGFGGGTGTAFQQPVPPSDGTGSTPFNPHTEKDGAASNVTNRYQSISFMQPYNKYSFEELRLGDYNQGRKFGNGSGQAGAFGSSAFGGSGFGQPQPATGFGASSTPFGGGTSAPSAFGQSQTAGAFGSTPSNPLFAASKPATPTLFGTSGTSQPGFGGATSTSGGFGGTSGTGGFGGGGTLFGGNQQQNKPAFGTGGAGTTGGTGFGGFGQQQTTSAPNPFGGTPATSSPFGGQQQTGTGFGGFGQQNQAQNQPQTQNKGLFGGGGFGGGAQQQQGTPSLFGGGTTGPSLFGQNNQPQQQQQPSSGSLFGGGPNQQTGTSSLFGGNAQQQGQKSLFGGGTPGTGTATGGGLSGFGGTQNQPTGTSSLFGGTQNQPQQKQSLFGGSTGTGTGGSLFGAQQPSAPQNTGTSLFGNAQPQQQQPGGVGTGGLFGATQQPQPQPQQQPQQPAPGSFQASLLDANPYGHQSIFSGLPAPSAQSPGPLATPLSSSVKQKQSQRAPLPIHKMTPSGANRLITPPKRPGYGFSYSTYGSPSNSTGAPSGMGGSLLGGSMRGSVNGSFSKSYSTSNLRNTVEPDTESVLSPGALSGQPRLSSSSVKRLTIDRSLRNDLFTRSPSTPAAPITNGEDSAQQSDKSKKKVSFDSAPANGVDGMTSGDIVPVESKSPEPTPEELGFLRSIRKNGGANGVNGDTPSSDGTARPEMESVRGNDLAMAAEPIDRAPATDGLSGLPFTPGKDPQAGEYWMRPTRAEISKMSREEQKHVTGYTVGRQNCGEVTFGDPVDLTTVNLDQVFGGLVDIALRRITVYPDESIKPPLGKGLNVPSTLRIENSWPRIRDKKSLTPLSGGPLFEKHIDRLMKVTNTEFVGYEKPTGTWVFKVPHFTTYGLDYEDSDEEGESHDQSTMGARPDTPKAHSNNLDHSITSELTFSTDDSFVGSTAGVDDDTFDFKKRKIVPGSFGNQEMEAADEDDEDMGSTEESFLEEGSTGSTAEQDNSTESQHSAESEVGLDEDTVMDMAGSFPKPHHTVERDDTESTDGRMEDNQPSMKPWNTPAKARLDLSGDWADQLRRTISPRKQDRGALREIQANAFSERLLQEDAAKEKPSADAGQKGFTTSIDLMNSLFQQPRKQRPQHPSKQNVQARGFEWPYTKQPKTFAGKSDELTQEDVDFHHSFKPRWGPMDTLICGKSDWREDAPNVSDVWEKGISIPSEWRHIKLLSFNKAAESDAMLAAQMEQSTIDRVDGIPFAHLAKVDFHRYSKVPAAAGQSIEEVLVWHMANILFNDDIEDDISASVPPQLRPRFAHRMKKDRLSRLWEQIIRERHAHDLENVGSPEECAVHLLSSHRIEEACRVVNQSRNFHLATLVPQIGRDRTIQTDMANQIEMWRQNNMYSEMTEPIRALYELLAGNALRSEGKLGGALEDRASTFFFTDRFDLDWFQAFGLRLWYGISEDEPVEAAVSKFLEDLASGNEVAFPHPSHLEEDRGVLHTARDMTGRESPLWVLLKLYSATVGADLPALEFPASLLPQSVSGDKLTNRLSFQLHQLLGAAVGQYDCFKANIGQADQLIWDFAWELSSSGQYQLALFVLLHLSRPVDREHAAKETLARFAPLLPLPFNTDGTVDATWAYLTEKLQLPETWIWVAKALDARGNGDATSEAGCLIKGKHWNDAHSTLCRIVAPMAVIERDYNTLAALISGFGDAPERRVRGWASGGGVYDDFLYLATARSGQRDPHRLDRLVNALVAAEDRINKGSGVEGLEQRVAFKEMSQAVANWAAHEGANTVESSTALNLPLTGDARVIQTAEMSRRYYGVIMAGAY